MSSARNESNNKVQKIDQVQSELDGLQRRFRDMEAKHRLFNDDSIQTIRMQRGKIDKLKNENERLKEELSLETRQAKMSLSSHRSVNRRNNNNSNNYKSNTMNNNTMNLNNPNNIKNLQESGEMYQRKIEIEKRRISELDLQIKKMEESILQQRSDMGGMNANRETSKTIQKNIRMLENRLDKALVKYNEALGHNKKLRETIDNLRRERVVFDGIYRKLEGDLISIKNEMSSIISEANQAYEQRDFAQSEMLRLKNDADREQKQFEHEWRELTKLIDQDKKMKDFLNTKDREKLNDAVVTSVLEKEEILRKKLSKGAWSIVKDKAHIHMAQEKVKNYEESFAKIANATGISDIDMLVNTFIESEEQNFKLFNQVNKLSNEIERYEESINNTKKEIQSITGANSLELDTNNINKNPNTNTNTNTEDNDSSSNNNKDDSNSTTNVNISNQRKTILQDLKNNINETEKQILFYKRKHNESLETMTSLKTGISQILEKIGVDNAMKDMIENTGVTESNVMGILGVIEQKTNLLIESYLSLTNNTNTNTNTNIHQNNNTDNNRQLQLQQQQQKDTNTITITNPNPQQLDDREAESAALGVGIGASSLKPLVATPASIFDADFSDNNSNENNDDIVGVHDNDNDQEPLNS